MIVLRAADKSLAFPGTADPEREQRVCDGLSGAGNRRLL